MATCKVLIFHVIGEVKIQIRSFIINEKVQSSTFPAFTIFSSFTFFPFKFLSFSLFLLFKFFFYPNPAVLIAAKYSAIQYGVILLLGVVKRAVAHISEHPPLMVPSTVTRLSHAAHIVKIIKLIKKIIQ